MFEKISDTTIILTIFVAIFSFIKIILVPQLRTVKKALASFFVGWPSGILAGLIALEYGAGQYSAIAVGCLFTLVAEHLIVSIIDNGSNINALVMRALNNLVDRWTK